MAVVRSHPREYGYVTPATPVVHALKQNKRPVGFAPWPEDEVTPATPKKKRKKAKKA